jgi:hypothetical protein
VSTDAFPFAFDRRFLAYLRVLGARPETSGVFVDDDTVRIVFGPWQVQTPLSNVARTEVAGDFRWYRVVGPHISLADRGATLGTNAEEGTCILFHEPVPLLLGRRFPHPGITVTVDGPRGLAASIERRRNAGSA